MPTMSSGRAGFITSKRVRITGKRQTVSDRIILQICGEQLVIVQMVHMRTIRQGFMGITAGIIIMFGLRERPVSQRTMTKKSLHR